MNQKKTGICLLLALYFCAPVFGQLVTPSIPSGFYTDSVFIHFDYPSDHTLYLGQNEDIKYNGGFYLKENKAENSFSEIRTNPINASSNHIWLNPKDRVRKAQLVYYTLYNGTAQVEKGVIPYFVGDFDYVIPVVSLIIDSTSLFGYEEGIYVPGQKYDDNPTLWQPGNYYERGRAWEREALVHIYDQDSLLLTQNIGVRLHGGGSRIMPMKSLRLYARASYGKEAIEYPFFEDKEVNSFKRLILRNSGQDFTKSLMRDGLAHSICQNLDVEYQAAQPIVLFINGSYWGIHNMRERYDKHYFKQYHNQAVDDIDLIEIQMAIDVDEGTVDQYEDFVLFYSDHDLSVSSNYDELVSQMDINNYIDYHISKVFFGNRDWPGNNTKMWKPHDESYRWRWALSDYDDAMLNVDYNSIEHSLNDQGIVWPNPEWSTLLFRKLMENRTFKEGYKSRLDQLLATDFNPDITIPQLHEYAQIYRPYIYEHIRRWNYPKDTTIWGDEILVIEEFLRNRGEIVKTHFDQLLQLVNVDFKDNVRVYPNPTHEWINIKSSKKADIFLISDIMGRVVKRGIDVNQIDVSKLKSGVYVINLYDRRKRIIGTEVFEKI